MTNHRPLFIQAAIENERAIAKSIAAHEEMYRQGRTPEQPQMFDHEDLPLFSGTAPRADAPAPFRPTQAARQLAIEMAREDSARDRERRDNKRLPEPPADGRVMTADTTLVDPNTGEVIAQAGQALDDEVLYRLESIGWYMNRCPHWGSDVPADWTGCGECLLADACYRAWERAQDRAREAA